MELSDSTVTPAENNLQESVSIAYGESDDDY